MATKISLENFMSVGRKTYDKSWDVWFDGDCWCLVRGTDFSSTAKGFQVTAHVAARRKGGTINTKIVGDKVYLVFTPNNEIPVEKEEGEVQFENWFLSEWSDGETHCVTPDITNTGIKTDQVIKLFKTMAAINGVSISASVIDGRLYIRKAT